MITPPPLQFPIASPGGGLSSVWMAWFDLLRRSVALAEDPDSLYAPGSESVTSALAAALASAVQQLSVQPTAPQASDFASILTRLADIEDALDRNTALAQTLAQALDQRATLLAQAPSQTTDPYVDHAALLSLESSQTTDPYIDHAALLAYQPRTEPVKSSLDQTSDDSLSLLAQAPPPAELVKSSLDQTSHDSLSLLALAPPPREFRTARYGQFLDTTTQVAAAIDTPTAITYNTVDLSFGVGLRSGSTSEIEVDTEGIYNFQFSVQLDKTSGGTAIFWIWPRLNGTDIANSASQIQVQGNNAEIFSAANFFISMKATDYVEFMFAVSDVSVELTYFAASAFRPAIPSIIVTVSDNIEGVK